ncbi:hypothetical protein [Tardiphaga sp. P9-11]|jgi:hypothetical protein|uniref:hypothetical protein n=1 Tax=Tardiphaga sp. P9-11 TaxID=2024614 RepID=UPI0011F0D7D6|nr:hypothetical protein [Tardiphaga sp. P9-11]KAA0076672.1 hypothetical protein CIW50_10830 [Tardiphaga sp. P9-11]
MIHPAAKFQFERAIKEYARWIAIGENERSPAPGWWWGSAFPLRDEPDVLPTDWSAPMGLPDGARYADAAGLFLAALAGQHFQPWPEDFPQRYRPIPATDTAVST